MLVTGGAGTGKTLVALHRAAHLARRAEGTVLFVTFSQGLAADLSARLDLLIDDEEVRRRVEVVNIDRLAHRIVTDAEGRPPKLAQPGELAELWRQAAAAVGCGRGPAFLAREWEQVVLAQNLRGLDEYLAAPRAGRGVEIGPDERRTVWACIEEFQARLAATGRRTLLQLAAEASLLLGRSTGDLLEAGGGGGGGSRTGISSWTRRRTCTRRSGGCCAPRCRPGPTTSSWWATRTSACSTPTCPSTTWASRPAGPT